MTRYAGTSEYLITILDASENIIGAGPLTTVLNVSTTNTLDTIGKASFTFPAGDARGALITSGRRFDIYDRGTFLGRYIYSSESLRGKDAKAMRTISCYDLLTELSRKSVTFLRAYSNQPVVTIINDLLSLVPGWSAEIDAGLGNESIALEGESVLAAIDILRQRLGLHYRLKTAVPGTKILQFGAFGVSSGVRIAKVLGQVQSDFAQHPEIAIVNNITLVDDAQAVYNRIIPVGAGQGVSQLNISGATLGSYTIMEDLNQDGSTYYYIEDAASIAQHGAIERVLVFDQIRPISNSDANILNAQNTLKLAAEAFLTRNKDPHVLYSTGAVALRQNVNVGQKVRLVYRGVVDGYQYIDVNADYWVIGLTRSRASGAKRSESLTISTTDRKRATNQSVIVNLVQDVSRTKIHIPLTLSYSPIGPYTRRIDATHTATFLSRIKGEVLALNRSLLRFNTAPLTSSVEAVASGGDHKHIMFVNDPSWPTGWPSPTVGHFVAGDDVAAFAYTNIQSGSTKDMYTYGGSGSLAVDLNYGIFQDTVFPADVSISINGVDVTTALGGPWGAIDATSGNIELDITEYLVSAIGGVRQNHEIVFSCVSGQGEIEAEVNNLLTIQPIAVT